MNDDVSVPGSIVKIDKDDLLPCSQCQFLPDEWKGEGRFHEGSPHVREPVAVTPAPIMLIGDIGRGKFFDGPFQSLRTPDSYSMVVIAPVDPGQKTVTRPSSIPDRSKMALTAQ